jgi:hypothetical protein
MLIGLRDGVRGLEHPDLPGSAVSMNQRLETALQLIAFAAFIAAVLIIVATSLTSLSTQCMRGEPFLPTIFPCFPPR